VHPDSDNPDRFAPGSVFDTASGNRLTVERSQRSPNSLLVRFRDVADRTAAERLGGEHLYIPSDARRPLDDDEYWPDDLIGLRAVSTEGVELGVVESVVEGSAQYRLSIVGESGRFEVPFVAELIPMVDVERGRLHVNVLPGLLPDR
jgi:16S rRNA processing protein RimM